MMSAESKWSATRRLTADLPRRELTVALHLIDRMDEHGQAARSYSAIAHDTKQTARTVMLAVNGLTRKGLIKVTKSSNGNHFKSNVYSMETSA
jgi:hypothetical protein